MTPVATGRLELTAVPGIPILEPGDDPAAAIESALDRAELDLRDGDVLAVASKLFSRSEGRFVSLDSVLPGAEAEALADRCGKDQRLVELVLRESVAVSRVAPQVLIVRHRLGHVSANAGIDASNVGESGAVLLLPVDPDRSAGALVAHFARRARIGVVVTDSLGRPFRLGTVGAALGVAGLPALADHRGRVDLFGRVLEHTTTALADQVAAAADLVAGQGAEGRPVVRVRGLRWAPSDQGAGTLHRPVETDLYA